MSFWYLATPYTKYRKGIEAAFQDAAKQAAILLRAGVPVFSPIAHTHPLAIYGGIDAKDHTVWLPFDRPMMDAAKGIIVCKLEGWDESYGVAYERDVFSCAGKPLIFMEPGKVPVPLARTR